MSEDGAGAQPATGRKNGLYPELSNELTELMRSGWADTERHDLSPLEQAPYAAKRRAALSARFPGERLVIPAGQLKVRSNDTDYPFRASCDYVHLTGDQTPYAVLLLEPGTDGGHDPSVYLLPRSNRDNGEFWLDPQGELWVGRRNSLPEAEELLGVACRDVRTVAEKLRTADAAPTRVVRGNDADIEAVLAEVEPHRLEPRLNDEEPTPAERRDQELSVFLNELRLVKDDFELAQLRTAVDSTVRGFEDVVRVLDQAVATSERHVEGTFNLRARLEGNDVGYGTIAASGPHACTLHWVRNDGAVRDGDLLLLDAGVETDTLYTADVTRTLPISGHFTELQRAIYDTVYEAQEAGIAAVRPGAPYRDFHDAAQRVLASRLVEWGILDGPVDRVLELGLQRRYTLHGTGHMLGLDVHDCAAARTEYYVNGTLRPGMVLTVEPGLYFQADDLTVPEEMRGVGVRIEDDILVTSDGNQNLSAGLPRTADGVVDWMARLR